jgi:hypothetical protein
MQPISVQTQLNSIYFIELHVSTCVRSSSVSHLVLKHTEEGINIIEIHKSQEKLLILLRLLRLQTGKLCVERRSARTLTNISYVIFETNFVVQQFYLLNNAPTCFGLNAWQSSGSSLQILLFFLPLQSCHSIVSSSSISMWIHSKFNFVSEVPSTLPDPRFQQGFECIN